MTLSRHLLLIAQHDRKGTVHPIPISETPTSRAVALLGLMVACNLVDTVFQATDRDAAKNCVDRIATQDTIVRTVRDATGKLEGT
ncbi:MAG: hypothetical protein GWP91_14400 [Rhodobacterales bacterium]|nr:hypothetical protein [Rhodobacterales bacterium]